MSASVTHCLLNCSISLNLDFIILSKFSTACVSPFFSARLRASIMLVELNESDKQTSIFNAALMGPNKQETAAIVMIDVKNAIAITLNQVIVVLC